MSLRKLPFEEVPGSIPGSGKGFYVWFFLFCCWCVLLLVQIHIFVTKFAIPFAIVIYWVYWTYCKIFDRFEGYKDTDLASLKLRCAINVLLLKTAFLFDYNIVKLTPGNIKSTFITWPAIAKCDPKLSNLQHAVGYSKRGDFKIKKNHPFNIVRMKILLNKLCSFVL